MCVPLLTMAASTLRSVTVYWDGVLDRLEDRIRYIPCVGCRAYTYYETVDGASLQHIVEFRQVEHILGYLILS
jgi:hypothetical protein